MENVAKVSALVLILIFGTALATTPKETKTDVEIKQILMVIRAFRNHCVVENTHGYWTTYGF